MKKYAFISRHIPTQGQIDLAAAQEIELIHVGDADAFTVTTEWVYDHSEEPFDGVIVVHPAAALRLAQFYPVGVFENANRAEPGQPPQFEAVSFHLYNLTGEL